MALPKTLLSMAGADLTPSSFSNSALVVIDCQQEYVDGALPLVGVEDALIEVARLLERARQCDTPIFHIAHKGQKGGVFDREEGGKGAFAQQAMPLEGETVIEKSLPNAFAGTNLEPALKDCGRSEIIICGFMTHMCVNSTARAGLDLGYRTTVVTKACATRDLPGLSEDVISANVIHEASLAGLADRYSILVASAKAIPD